VILIYFNFQADQDLLDHKDQEGTKGAEGIPEHVVQPDRMDLRDCQVIKTFSLFFPQRNYHAHIYEKMVDLPLHAKMLTQLSGYGRWDEHFLYVSYESASKSSRQLLGNFPCN
jgi:hypothetical protein